MRPLVLLRANTLPFETLAPLRARRAPPLLDELLALEDEDAARTPAIEEALFAAAGDRTDDPLRARGRLAVVALRRDVHNGRPIRPGNLEPARPWIPPDLASRLETLAALRRRRRDLLDACRRAAEEDVLAARAALPGLLAPPVVQEAVWLSSRELFSAARGLAAADPSRWGHRERHAAAKAVSYLARFCTKTSPNSLFCATALAACGGERIEISGSPAIERVDVILNTYEARKITACLGAGDDARPAIAPRPNPTLRAGDGVWTFWKPASLRYPTDDEVLSRAKDQPVLRAFIEEAGPGRRGVDQLLEAVGRRCGASRDELEAFYRALVERGILIAEIEIPYSERRPLRRLAGACRRAGAAAPWAGTLEEVEQEVDRLAGLPHSRRLEAMDRISARLEALPHGRPLKPDEMFRLDAASALRVRLPGSILDELRASLRPYVRLFGSLYPHAMYRASTARRFLAKHPADTDVPLLDLYHGLFEAEEKERPAAFPDPVLVAPSAPGAAEAAAAMRRARAWFARRAREAGPGGEVEIRDEDLDAVLGPSTEPPFSCGVLFQVASRGPEAIEEGRYRIVLSAIFQGSGLALARFGHLHGEGAGLDGNPVVRELRRCWSSVERAGAIVAELTYNHNARTANAGLRPSIFRHEIELPGEKASPGVEVIPLRDLVVRWDASEERFVLGWPARGVEVIPVINSGVNPEGFISFLVGIGQQGFQPLGYFPGFEAEGVTRWPRFVCGRLVLFRERWAFGPEDWPAGARAGAPLADADVFVETARWRRRHGIPRHVFVHTSADPKPRYLDLESPLFVDLLRRSLPPAAAVQPRSDRPEIHVTEMLPHPDDLWVAGEDGRYATEFLVHLHNPEPGRIRETP